MAAYPSVSANFGRQQAAMRCPTIGFGSRFFQYLVQRFNHAGIIHSLTPSLVSYVQR